MKKRYYLRGLGIGIFLTALIMGLAKGDAQTMTDEEVKARATELGMVEKKTLSDVREDESITIQNEKEEQETSTPEPTVTKEPQTSAIPEETPLPLQTEEPQMTEAPAETSPPMTTDTPEQETIFEVEIVKGDSSNSVSKKLEQLGLIADAKSYNRYLCDNGYDRRLNIGTYKIKRGTGEEEIAKIITRTR